jgi:adenylate cyclase
MTGAISGLTRVRLQRCLQIAEISATTGAIYGLVLGITRGPFSAVSLLNSTLVGVVDGTVIGLIAVIEIFVLRHGRTRWLDALPLIAVILLKTLVYGAVAAVVAAGQPGEHLLGAGTDYDARSVATTIAFSLAVTGVLVIVFQAAGLVGYSTFIALLLGKYRQPHAQRRFFLFVDVVSSTAIAERLGPREAHRFLAAVFKALAEPIALCRGEIYQYVGDEIVVTWIEADGVRESRALRCLFEMRAALEATSSQFRARFGVDAQLRAALHLGDVIAGEVGEMRRAIVFHGDVMNAAGRLEQATREINCRFIASADALSAFGPLPWAQMHDLGALVLRGKAEPIQAFCVDSLHEAPSLN